MMRFKEDISKEEIAGYEVMAFDGKIVCIDSPDQVDEAMNYLWNSSYVGFDTETKPSFRKGENNRVSLLQLSVDGHAFLFRLNRVGLPDKLARFLSSESVIKVGVAIRDDIKALRQLNNFEPGGFIDLQEMVRDYGILSSGLKKLSAIVLGHSISKRQQVSNWENESLTQAQQVYAATDAWVCMKIYEKLLNS
ncbi:MAG: 3'-5' exonuclease [Bacteroidales bacterium]